MSDPSSTPPPPTASAESMDSAILRLLMETIPDTIYFKDLESRFVRVNLAQAHLLGLARPEDAIGKSDADFCEPAQARAFLAAEQEVIRTGRPLLGQVEQLRSSDGRIVWGSTSKLPWHDAAGRIIGTFGLTRIITASKIAEEKLVDERNLLQTIIDHLPSNVFVKDKEGRYLVNNLAHQHFLGVTKQEDVIGRTVLDFFPRELGRQAAADDQQVLAGGPPILNREEPDYGPAGLIRCSLTTKVPLRDLHGNITGLLGISHDITKRKRTEQELQRRTAEMETDLRMARQIQESFFPREYPVFPRGVPSEASALRFAHRYVPAATLGGDFFDIIQLSDTHCVVLVCDVMGHGVRAGLLTALIRGVVKEIGASVESPAYVLGEINRSLTPILEQTGQPLFATVFLAMIDTAAGSLAFANAGHPPPFVLHRASGTVEKLEVADPEPAAGLIDGFAYAQREFPFRSGDVFIGYTDGLFEACDSVGNSFGDERLRTLIAQSAALPIAQLIDRLMTEVQAFSGHNEFEDDVCVVAVESTGLTSAVRPRAYDI
jgi:sigma-B regulation protein RsbU (phosphoserine phosphatase)